MAASTEPTIREHLAALLPRMSHKATAALPVWPPDAFALCMSLLQKSAAYCTVLESWPPKQFEDVGEWAEQAQETGYRWRQSWVEKKPIPSPILKQWKYISSHLENPLSKIKTTPPLAQALLAICAFSDEACVDVGTPVNREIDEDDEDSTIDFLFASQADSLLGREKGGASLCEEIDCARARVLPKQHTPQNGLTTRSLSLYIGLSLAHEVKPIWIQSARYEDAESLNLLLVPWPYEIARTQFQAKEPLEDEMRNMPDEFGFFSFHQNQETERLIAVIFDFYTRAEQEFGRLGGIVLPECALSSQQFDLVRTALKKRRKRCMLIAGVGDAGKPGKQHDCNTVRVHIPEGQTVIQHKHHRWKLTRSQLMQYNLGGVLSPSRNWWEHINLGERTLTFVSLLSTLTLSVLVCEDLARPDPVADVVRVVGPNLVIALLMDGPQLKERWPTRHAITLADDPGCSVLSFTSLGMCRLSKPIQQVENNHGRVIALWKDPFDPAPREIDIPEGCGAVVISLSLQDQLEWTADGRSSISGVPRLTGVYPLTDSK